MAKRFPFVSGDMGGTKAMVAPARLLKEWGHNVIIVADGAGRGVDVWRQEKFNFTVVNDLSGLYLENIAPESDLVFIMTCATATKVEEELARQCYGRYMRVPTVMGAGGFFDHGLKKWRSVKADYWFAITEGHAQAIRSLRPELHPSQVKVVGQPVFDPLIDLVPRKDEIRKMRRLALGLSDNEIAFLWFSTGLGELIEEDIEMAQCVVENLGKLACCKKSFIVSIHPKLEDVRKGYVDNIRQRIQDCCALNNVRMITSGEFKAPLEEVSLTSDGIFTIFGIEEAKNTLMGGPPVVHFLGPIARNFLKKEFSLQPPHYFPDVISGESLAVFSYRDIYLAVNDLVNNPGYIRRNLRAQWQPPKEKAAEKIAKALISLAR